MINSYTKLYAIAGKPVLHSKSPEIYNGLFHAKKINSHYVKITAKDAKGILSLSKLLGLSGINITAPFKETFMNLGVTPDNVSKSIGACNTIRFTDKKIESFNFDSIGVVKSVNEKITSLKNCHVLVIGAGGAAKAAVFGLIQQGAYVSISNRTKQNAENIAKIFPVNIVLPENIPTQIHDFDLIVNTIEYPFSIFDISILKKGQMVLDANYKNSIFKDYCIQNNIAFIDGFPWLMHQATCSFEAFTGILVSTDYISKNLIQNCRKKKNVISFIGLSGSGKSSLGKSLAKSLNWDFVDTDLEIERMFGLSITDIFKQHGESVFRDAESKLLESLKGEKNLAISTGGGLVLDESNRKFLKDNTLVIHLMADTKTLAARITPNNRPLLNFNSLEEDLQKMFANRKTIYLETADLVFFNQDLSIEEATEILRNEGF